MLAHDIHFLMSILEGGDNSEMKELLSSGKSQRYSPSRVYVIWLISCDCDAEIKPLVYSMNNLIYWVKDLYVISVSDCVRNKLMLCNRIKSSQM